MSHEHMSRDVDDRLAAIARPTPDRPTARTRVMGHDVPEISGEAPRR